MDIGVLSSDRARHVDMISRDTRLPEQPSALPYLLQVLSDNNIDYHELAVNVVVDSLKVDQAFLNNLLDDADYSVIVATIIAMGRAMRLTVVAEGVETLEQVQYLSALGCNVAQGYFFSRPVPDEQVPDLIVTSFLPKIPQGSVVALTKV